MLVYDIGLAVKVESLESDCVQLTIYGRYGERMARVLHSLQHAKAF